MNWGYAVTLLIAVVSALSAWASQRAAARATTLNTETTSRVDMEKEAYERARKFDIETITRQDAELEEVREKLEVARSEASAARAEARSARAEVREAHEEIDRLRKEVRSLQRARDEDDEQLDVEDHNH